jgi:hypothetical protein
VNNFDTRSIVKALEKVGAMILASTALLILCAALLVIAATDAH